jgi:hypothetical protein
LNQDSPQALVAVDLFRATRLLTMRLNNPDNHLTKEKLFMNGNSRTPGESDSLLATLAADLTSAVYPVALRHAKPSSWVDLELDLWRALTETIQKWRPEYRTAAN